MQGALRLGPLQPHLDDAECLLAGDEGECGVLHISRTSTKQPPSRTAKVVHGTPKSTCLRNMPQPTNTHPLCQHPSKPPTLTHKPVCMNPQVSSLLTAHTHAMASGKHPGEHPPSLVFSTITASWCSGRAWTAFQNRVGQSIA